MFGLAGSTRDQIEALTQTFHLQLVALTRGRPAACCFRPANGPTAGRFQPPSLIPSAQVMRLRRRWCWGC